MLSRLAHRLAFTAGATLLIGAAALGSSTLLGACGGDDATTTGERVKLATRVVADDGVLSPFTNAYGWSVKLSKVAVSLGAAYYFDGAPIFSAGASPPRSRPRFGHFFAVRAAHAHPGHYVPGNALGQMLTPSSADLALGPADLADGEGTTGTFRSGRLVFGDPPVGPAAATLGASVVVLEGEAKKGALVRVFRASGSAADAADSYGEPRLEGCVFTGEPEILADGVVTIHVRPSVWLDQADFEPIAESGDSAPVDLAPGDEAFKAFARGLKKGSAVVFSYEAD